jgi:hypothetical protein
MKHCDLLSSFIFLTFTVSTAWLSSSNVVRSDSKSKFVASVDADVSEGRRRFFGSIGVVGSALLTSQPAFADASQEDKDKANILKGYKRLQYLLDNWEKETTVCKTGQETTFGDQCQRSPMKVMDYLGYRATNDPLFKADKAMMRLFFLVPSDKEGDFFDAVERYGENAEEASGLAYLSSWGESNPGGGKDRVELFIERARKNVIVSKESLETVIGILDLKP